MTPIQQLMLGVGAKKKTYVDDVFSTFVYAGNATSGRAINTGVDMTEGGLLWIKNRSAAISHMLMDTVNGGGKYLSSDTSGEEETMSSANSFNNNGFTLGNGWGLQNASSYDYTSFSFRKAPGFFDVVTWDGDGSSSNRNIAHNLGSIPGMIIMKAYQHPSGVGSTDWQIYHRGLNGGVNPEQYALMFSTAAEGQYTWFGNTAPTATQFTVGSGQDRNGTGGKYVAYLFAGGESTAATARSVDFDGSGDYLTTVSNSDLEMGSGDFTIEAWVKPTDTSNNWNCIFTATHNLQLTFKEGAFRFYTQGIGLDSGEIYDTGQWYHVAVTRSGTKFRLFVNGLLKSEGTTSNAIPSLSGVLPTIGAKNVSGNFQDLFKGQISNLRIVKGTAVYTSSFRPLYEPLTNITNTKLLCCNNSSTTGSTVTPGTITANGSPTASSDSPFDDPAGFVFGGSGTESVIKCGSYFGNGNADGPEVNIGFEPQWLLVKNTNLSTEQWFIFDSMRGIVTGGTDYVLEPSRNVQEAGWDLIDLTPTGFKIKINDDKVNNSGGKYVYVAIRRPDGYVSRPVEDPTSVFAMDTGTSSSAGPVFDSGFPVDFALQRYPALTEYFIAQSRLQGPKYLSIGETSAESTQTAAKFDYNDGWAATSGWDSDKQSWMWKRHAGFDVVVTGPGTGDSMYVRHSLGRQPEMIWAKKRATSNWSGNSSSNYRLDNWWVWHKDASTGTTADRCSGFLNTADSQPSQNMLYSSNTNAVAASFYSNVTFSGDENLMLFFASVDGISSVGSYSGSTSNLTLDLGFQPRLFICKQIDAGGSWVIFDSVRGMGSGNDSILYLDSSSGSSSSNRVEATSSGITLYANTDTDVLPTNTSHKCIYYAHA